MHNNIIIHAVFFIAVYINQSIYLLNIRIEEPEKKEGFVCLKKWIFFFFFLDDWLNVL